MAIVVWVFVLSAIAIVAALKSDDDDPRFP